MRPARWNETVNIKFTKMHGLGNDFVVLDATAAPMVLTAAQLRFIADRHFGVGCDQLLMVEPARTMAHWLSPSIFST